MTSFKSRLFNLMIRNSYLFRGRLTKETFAMDRPHLPGRIVQNKKQGTAAPLNSWHVFAKHYAGDTPLDNPFVSPLFGNLKGLPPLFINAGMDNELF